ncbi:uncharacterized protein BP5553_08071 [Venustampulla echinocandica]|uniref:Uncharacterized protein n=1 Tax=Venustampulla echinocandica TaxID=2656787 RepID=A0A370TFN0_9HELO|nr:uncharacterized protein BP5553_08071 [Venustampulla echinocandica]RDL33703.1 hypothetical protein BP5553_08071 [Venustampulla echinocandica]
MDHAEALLVSLAPARPLESAVQHMGTAVTQRLIAERALVVRRHSGCVRLRQQPPMAPVVVLLDIPALRMDASGPAVHQVDSVETQSAIVLKAASLKQEPALQGRFLPTLESVVLQMETTLAVEDLRMDSAVLQADTVALE